MATYDAADRILTFTLTSSGEIFNLAYDDKGTSINPPNFFKRRKFTTPKIDTDI